MLKEPYEKSFRKVLILMMVSSLIILLQSQITILSSAKLLPYHINSQSYTSLKSQTQISINQNIFQCNVYNTIINNSKIIPQSTDNKYMEYEYIFDKLQPLKGLCIHHFTKQFVYQYCVGGTVRQFDNFETLTQNAKTQYQNIVIGKQEGSPEQPEKISEGTGTPYKTPLHNLLSIQALEPVIYSIETSKNLIRLNKDENNVYRNYHLITAEIGQNQTINKYTFGGWGVSNSEIIVFESLENKKILKIQKVTQIKANTEAITFESNNFFNQKGIFCFRNYVYGNLQTIQHIKHLNGKSEQQIKVGTLIQMIIISEGVQYAQIFQVQTLTAENVLKVKYFNNSYINTNNKMGKDLFSFDKEYRALKVQIISYNKVQQQRTIINLNTQLKMIKIVQRDNLRQKFQQNLTGKSLNCLYYNRYLNVEIGQMMIDDFYQGYFTNKFPTNETDNILCYQYSSKIMKQEQKVANMALEAPIKYDKLSSKESIQINLNESSYFLKIDISTVLKISMIDKNNSKICYYISDSKIYALTTQCQFSGDCAIVMFLQNSYYQNSTSSSKIIYIRKIVSSGNIILGVWRKGDIGILPRITLSQVEGQLSVQTGTAHIRTISNVNSQIPDQFSQDNNLQILNNFNTLHTLMGGQFCSNPINKNRQTVLKIQCGQPYLKIEKVKEVSPCNYQMWISSSFLCVKEKILNYPSKIEQHRKTICFPKQQ